VPVQRPFPAPPGRTEITGRPSGRNAHPAGPPGPGQGVRKQAARERRAVLFAGPVARSARGCVQDAAAHDRKPGGQELSTGSADAVDTSVLLAACRVSNGDLLITSRNFSVAYGPYQHQWPRGCSHHAPLSPPMAFISRHEPHHGVEGCAETISARDRSDRVGVRRHPDGDLGSSPSSAKFGADLTVDELVESPFLLIGAVDARPNALVPDATPRALSRNGGLLASFGSRRRLDYWHGCLGRSAGSRYRRRRRWRPGQGRLAACRGLVR
jgi:hypothetical protein